jgi:hypothetical protein
MKARILLWSVISALAGFLFGFDTVVISGAEQTIQSLWGLSAGMQGFAMASVFAPGCVFLFFCGMMVLELIWIKTMVPETKGVPLEQMQEKLGITLDDPTEALPAGEASNRTGGR